ncbi:MAG: hypothetical protein RLZZ401_910 [Pseudomonadota bacterium]|jgi:Skp family chaperone for outer membrane proteins
MKASTLLTTLALACATTSLFAQAPANANATPGIDTRQANQQARIDQGVASGQLTAKEAARLEQRQAKIAADEAAAKADGKVTRQERKELTREQNRASGAIHHQKHDRQRSGS